MYNPYEQREREWAEQAQMKKQREYNTQMDQQEAFTKAGWGTNAATSLTPYNYGSDYQFVYGGNKNMPGKYAIRNGPVRLGKYTTATPTAQWMQKIGGTFDAPSNSWLFDYNPYYTFHKYGNERGDVGGLTVNQTNGGSLFKDFVRQVAPVAAIAAIPFGVGALQGAGILGGGTVAGTGGAGGTLGGLGSSTSAMGGMGSVGGASTVGSLGGSTAAGMTGGLGGAATVGAGSIAPAGGLLAGQSAPMLAGGALSAGSSGGGALSALKGFLGGNSMGGGALGLSNGQMLLGGADLAGRLWQSGQLNDIAREAARRGSALDQPQRQAFQAQLNAYMNGERDLTKLPLVKSAMDSVTRQTMAKAAAMGQTGAGNLPTELQNNLVETFNKQGQPFLNFLSELGGYPQGPGGAGQLYGQYASQATGAPFLGIDAMAKAATFNRSNIPDWYWHANNVQQRPSLGFVS